MKTRKRNKPLRPSRRQAKPKYSFQRLCRPEVLSGIYWVVKALWYLWRKFFGEGPWSTYAFSSCDRQGASPMARAPIV